MATIRILLVLFCMAFISRYINANGRILNPQHTTRNTLISIARSQIGVREATGRNDGPQVEAYLHTTGLPPGHPWCAAFISWVFKRGGYAAPRTAWAPALFPKSRQTQQPQPADVLGLYSATAKRIVHAGLVERRQHHWVISIEGNTQHNGHDGVYRKWRHIKTISCFADWVKP